MELRKFIRKAILKCLTENKLVDNVCIPLKLTNEIIDEVKKFNTSEELLRSGGISIEALDRAAHGFSSDDIKTLMPKQLSVKWKVDLEQVKWEIELLQKKHIDRTLGDVMKIWAKNINLEEPIDVSYEKNKFYIEDGHHRYYAAKILNKPLNVNIEIKMNPIVKLAPSLSYDEFHRCIFNQINNIDPKKIHNEQNIINENVYNVFHGSNDIFDGFDYDKIGSNTETSWNGAGFYFSDTKTEASLYGKNILNVQIELKKPIDLTVVDDSSVQGSGLINFFSTIKGFENITHYGKTIKEISKIINELENNFNENNISFSEGTNEHFKHVWYEYDGNEYVIRNKTENEINNSVYIKSLIISSILNEKYNITGLPIRIKELLNPFSFTKIAKENGYDGVIAHNSTTMDGYEYVVFDNKNIKILK